ncbi:hypothetical protein BpHYR1_038742 [Brachionus plicatilis]|uniref:Uncharacterized protein n=1 Tax=Brachionus plicatilis TaxID=10195 RepID=A0A3M7RKI1_BRAPC|nr:hypothetical protein BpHYR1_038742 [Brachionus plicatilis]
MNLVSIATLSATLFYYYVCASFNTYRYYFFPDIYISFLEKKNPRSTNRYRFLAFRVYSINLNISNLKNGYCIRYWIWFRQVLFFVSTIALDPYFFDKYPEVSYNSAIFIEVFNHDSTMLITNMNFVLVKNR